MERFPCVYILTNKRLGVLYVGVTSNLPNRIWQHRNDLVAGFTRTHTCHQLIWYEPHADMYEAIVREKRIKRWHRDWKIRLIEEMNPYWRDLYPSLL